MFLRRRNRGIKEKKRFAFYLSFFFCGWKNADFKQLGSKETDEDTESPERELRLWQLDTDHDNQGFQAIQERE